MFGQVNMVDLKGGFSHRTDHLFVMKTMASNCLFCCHKLSFQTGSNPSFFSPFVFCKKPWVSTNPLSLGKPPTIGQKKWLPKACHFGKKRKTRCVRQRILIELLGITLPSCLFYILFFYLKRMPNIEK
ncbi:hypothetical protein DM01DRAFT_1193779 [Hesseltinella vesiculosa]|uniref:Uncharacterized protein n=1 Tax=Hesseltinella vesiculosa TaxID=101127 RepID=A0A1X2G3T0_9FUNG|nr:hypothetical protein DM01DRAFT_1193779 [Hesseltinella vesiculosa]